MDGRLRGGKGMRGKRRDSDGFYDWGFVIYGKNEMERRAPGVPRQVTLARGLRRGWDRTVSRNQLRTRLSGLFRPGGPDEREVRFDPRSLSFLDVNHIQLRSGTYWIIAEPWVGNLTDTR